MNTADPTSFDNSNHETVQLAPRKYEIIYTILIFLLYVQIAGLYGGYLALAKAKWMTVLFTYVLFYAAIIGITIGAHRLWSHKSFKAKPPLEIFLIVCNTVACHYSAYNWVRDHRLHHKYSDTDADPSNANRGFLYAHIGWIFVKKHPEVKRLGPTICMDDIRANTVVYFQKRNAKWLLPLVGFIIPTIIPVLFWNEDLITAWHLVLLRYTLTLHVAFSGNSLAHFWGYKPYDKTMRACQNLLLNIMTLGEGFHNFHHTFPFDYRASEKGNSKANINAMFLDFCAKLDLAYDLKEASDEVITKRKERKMKKCFLKK